MAPSSSGARVTTRTAPAAPEGAAPRAAASSRLLTLVHRRGPLSRAEITDELGLARSAVGTALDELAARRLVRVNAPVRGAHTDTPVGRGRPSPEVAVDPGGPVVIAVQLSRGGIRAAVVGLGQRVDRVRDEAHAAALDPRAAAEQAGRMVRIRARM